MILELEPVFNNIGFKKSFDYELNLSDCEFNGERLFKQPILVKGTVQNSSGIVTLKAEMLIDAELSCDRCATQILRKNSVLVEHILVTELNDEDNDDFLVIEGMSFDLDPLVTEDIFLQLPTKVLCSDDCKGICVQCGKNLNDGPCSCQKPIDPRLEALKQLLDS